MPVKITKLGGGKAKVSTPGGTKAKATTPEKGAALKRLLEGVEHSDWRPTGEKIKKK